MNTVDGRKEQFYFFFCPFCSQNRLKSRKPALKVQNNSKNGCKNVYDTSLRREAPNLARLEGIISDSIAVLHGIYLRQKKSLTVIKIRKKKKMV